MDRKRKRMPERQKGFSLIELLVVMVILGILGTLVAPRIFGQLDKAKDTENHHHHHRTDVGPAGSFSDSCPGGDHRFYRGFDSLGAD